MDDEEGLFAYVFIEAADPGKTVRGLVNKLNQRGEAGSENAVTRVRFATVAVGAYEGFSVVQAQALSDLEDFLQEQELWSDQKSILLEAAKGFRPAKRDTCEMLAIMRIQTKRGEAQAVFDKLNTLVEDDERYHGVSMVFGRFDILLTLDASDMETLQSLVMGIQTMDGLEGIVRTETSFADCREA